MSLKQKVLSGLAWGVVVKAVSQILTWCSTLIVIRLLTPDDYALIALVELCISTFIIFGDMGLGPAVIQSRKLETPDLKAVFGAVIMINSTVFVIFQLAAASIANWFGKPTLEILIRVMTLQFLVFSFYVIPNALLSKQMRFKAKEMVRLAANICGALTTLTMAWKGYGVWALVWGALCVLTVSTVGYWILAGLCILPSFKFGRIKRLFQFGGFSLITGSVWSVTFQLDIFLIGRFLTSQTLGVYKVALTLAKMPLDKVGAIIHQLGLASFATLQKEPQTAGKYVIKATRLIAFVAFPVFFGIAAIAPEALPLMLGDKWLAAVVPLQLLCLVQPLVACAAVTGPAVYSLGYPAVNTRLAVLALILMGGAFGLGLSFGILGVCLAWLAGYGVWFLVRLYWVLPILQAGLGEYLAPLLRPLMVAGVMLGGVSGARHYLMDSPALLRMFILTLVGVAIYAAGMGLCFRGYTREVAGYLRRGSA